MADFWQRWHITLSRWLRDYLYIPLGGNRRGRLRTSINLVITMVLGGLWHGAAWTFVLWGLWHGLALAGERTLRRWWELRRVEWLGRLATSLIVLMGWVLFRSESLADSWVIYDRLWTPRSGILWMPPLAWLAIVCMVAEHVAWKTRLRIAMRLPFDRWYSPIATALMLWCLLLYAPRGFTPFVYFQF